MPSVTLITATGATPPLLGAGEAHFAVANNPKLRLRGCPQTTLAYLEHRIVASPADLRSHTQRILLLLDQGRSAELPGALVDLYIALGPQGNALKQHLLQLATPRLPGPLVSFFRRYLHLGFKPWQPNLISIKYARLPYGYTGTHELIRRLEQRVTRYHDVQAEVQAYLEYGQVDAACDALEAALRQTPEDDTLATALLEIYHHTRDQARQATMRAFLLSHRTVLPPSWT